MMRMTEKEIYKAKKIKIDHKTESTKTQGPQIQEYFPMESNKPTVF